MKTVILLSLAIVAGNPFCAASPTIVPEPLKLELTPGLLEIEARTRIVCTSAESLAVAKLFSEELNGFYGLNLPVIQALEGEAGDFIFAVNTDKQASAESYKIHVGNMIRLEAADEDGFFAGTATLLQALRALGGKVSLPKMVVEDHPQSNFRGHMIDVKNYWHDLDELKRYIRLCRLYKLKYLSLHTSEAQWIGAVTQQLERLSPEQKRKHKLYSKAEMDELIAYARRHGVRMLPHNESTPHFGHQVDAMIKDFVPGDRFKGFADELDGKGSFADYAGKANERWLGVMEEATRRAIDQFAASHPDGVLPYYHAGPVQGEGGMGPDLAVRILEMISEKSPRTKMMFWNGINAKDKKLSPYKDKIVIAYYDDEFGASDLNTYLNEGWTVVNSAWSPLYVAGADLARPVEKVFNDWHVKRQGSDGIPGGYGAIRWELVEGNTLPQRLIGGMFCTWEVPTQVHFDRVRTRAGAFSEHAWGSQSWPYKKGAYENFAIRLKETDRLLSRYLNEPKEAPAPPIKVKVSQGTAKGVVRIEWRGGGGAAVTGFRVLRSKIADLAQAKDVSGDLDLFTQDYNDETIELERRYFYWVKAFNEYGESEATGPIEGSAGTGVANIASYEPFKYGKDVSIAGAEGGAGWAIPWRVEAGADASHFDPKGLRYEPLTTSGGSLRVNPKYDKNKIKLVREIDGKMGLDQTTMWLSYLVQADEVGIGDVFVVPNDFVFSAVGKNWGKNFALYTSASRKIMKEGETHFVVARFDFNQGDNVWLWVDPPLDREPQKSEADQYLQTEIGSGSRFRVELQGYGQGNYRLDEFRLGTSWTSVGGLTGADDEKAPHPNPMTWIGPPSVERGRSIYMMAAPAKDESGVEFYFESVSGDAPDSGWQSSSEYRLKDLKPGTYSFRVRCRDGSVNRNMTQWSFAGKVQVK